MAVACSLALAASVGASAPVAWWPSQFVSNFTETYLDGGTGSGFWALDMQHAGGAAQAILRSDGSHTSCGYLHKNTPCVELAVGGVMYIDYPELGECCSCCTYDEGCGPIEPKWTENAVYQGRVEVEGTQCDNFTIQGVEARPNWLLQTVSANRTATNDGSEGQDGSMQICEVNNGGHEDMVFDRASFSRVVDPAAFRLPAYGCEKQCGAAPQPYDCKLAYLTSKLKLSKPDPAR
jgi:hypothetical protein